MFQGNKILSQETNFETRTNKVLKVVNQLCELNHEQLLDMLINMQEVLEYNRSHLILQPRKHSIDLYNQIINTGY